MRGGAEAGTAAGPDPVPRRSVPSSLTASGYALAEADHEHACEHVVEMLRFDESRTLAALLRAGAASEDDVRMVARRIAGFHSTAAPAPPESFGPSEVAVTVSENFTTLLGYADQIGEPRLAAAHRFAVAFLHGRREELAARRAAGFIRECHGDLRAEHVVLGGTEVEIFDPVEFDPALRLWTWLRTSHSSSWSSWSPAARTSRGCLWPSTAMPAATPAATRWWVLRRLSRLGPRQGGLPARLRARRRRGTAPRAGARRPARPRSRSSSPGVHGDRCSWSSAARPRPGRRGSAKRWRMCQASRT